MPHPMKCSVHRRYVFLTNQRVDTPSTWSHSYPDLSEAEEAGATNYHTLGCQFAPKASSNGEDASAASSTSTATAADAGATAATATSGVAAETTNGAKSIYLSLIHI